MIGDLKPILGNAVRHPSTLALQNTMNFFSSITLLVTAIAALGLSIGCGSKSTPTESPKVAVADVELLSVTFFVDGMV